MKIVIVLLAVLLLAWLVFGFGRRSKPPPSAAPRQEPPARRRGNGAVRELEGMVACAHCGVHLPASESLRLGALHYCGSAHRDAGPRPPPA